MLEIIALIFISKHIAVIAEDKGYSHGLYRFLTFLFWIGFEFFGAIVGFIVFGEKNAGVYLFALVSAGLGYLIIYMITNGLPDKNPTIISSVYMVNCETLPVYEKTIETSKIIKEFKKGDIIEIDSKTDFNRFYKVQLSPVERGFILKSSDISMQT